MLNKIVVTCYRIIPTPFKNFIGRIHVLKPIRDKLLRQNNSYKEVCGIINRIYQEFVVSFSFYGSIQDVAKAQKKGVETTLLNNSIKLCYERIGQQKNLTILDIGANFGFLSLVWAHTICKDQGKVIAFEPNKYVYDSFSKSIAKNGIEDVITLENLAIGSEKGMVELFLNNTTSNILKSDPITNSVKIPMVSVDTYLSENKIKSCHLIKIDVDGIELDILMGSVVTLRKFKPIFIVETNENNDIIDFFISRDYKVLDMDLNEYIKSKSMPPNVFCVPN